MSLIRPDFFVKRAARLRHVGAVTEYRIRSLDVRQRSHRKMPVNSGRGRARPAVWTLRACATRESESASLQARIDRVDRVGRRDGRSPGRCAAATGGDSSRGDAARPNTTRPNTARPSAARPSNARQSASGLRRHRRLRALSRAGGKEHHALAPRSGQGSAFTRRHARMRKLPRSRAGTCGRRREGAHQEVQDADAY